MRATHFERLPMPGGYSIERLFREVRRALPERFSVSVVRCETPHHSRWWLVRGIVRARARAAQVNHIVGDVHYVALGLPGQRTILTVHDLNHLGELKAWRRVLARWLYFSLPLRRCRFVTAISECTRERLVGLFPFVANKIVVIPDCVPDGFAPRLKAFNKDCPRILQIGARTNKNLERVARALQGERCVLHVIGRLSQTQRRLLEDHGVSHENSVDLSDEALLQAYEEADLVVFASLAEGFGLPIIEANAMGRAVVTSNLSPMKEVAADAACLVDPYDVDDIRRGIRRVIEDDGYRGRLIERGHENATRFTARVVAEQYARLYEKIAGETSSLGKVNACSH
jgi:glycosyltransferase involved in cell wall biosynthesis